MKIAGGCLWGAVRYEASEALVVVGHCHCVHCRKHTGAAFATDATFNTLAVKWTGEEPSYYYSSPDCGRGFCKTCGSTVCARYDGKPEVTIIAAGSFDVPDVIVPLHHAYVSRKLSWIRLDDGLPVFETDTPGYEPENR